MTSPMTLRSRVTCTTALLGFVLTVLCAAATLWVTEDYEHVLAREILQGQAEDYGLRMANNLPAPMPQTQRLTGYKAGDANLPAAYASMPKGVHEDANAKGLHVGVFDTSAGRLYFTIDLSDIELIEKHLNWLLAAMIVFGTALSGWLGWLLSGTALKPVRHLAEGVEALSTTPENTHLAELVSDDDLGRLAAAIDGYQARLVDADANEQAFFADASHELRTPLTVIQGVTDVLLDDPPQDRAGRARLERLERGVRDMRDLLEAMLGAARRKPLQPETFQAAAFLREAAQSGLTNKSDIQLAVDAEGTMTVPRQEATLLIGGLVKRMVQRAGDGVLSVQLEKSQLTLQLDSSEIPVPTPGNATRAADLGTGSALLDRLAGRLGWRIQFVSATHVEMKLD